MRFKDFFSYDNKFFYIINKITDCFFLSLLWLICCVPVITIGTSTTALYDTIHKVLRGNRGYIWHTFWGSFRSNFKQTLKIWLLMLLLLMFLVYDRGYFYVNHLVTGSPGGVLYYFFSITLLFMVVWLIYIFAYTARFELDIKNTIINASIMALRHLPSSLLILILFIAAWLIIYMLSPFWLALLPAVIGLLYERILERIFRQYMSREDLEREKERELKQKE